MATVLKLVKDAVDKESTTAYFIYGVAFGVGSTLAGIAIAYILDVKNAPQSKDSPDKKEHHQYFLSISGDDSEAGRPSIRLSSALDDDEEHRPLNAELSINSRIEEEDSEITDSDNTKSSRQKEAENLLTLLYNIGENQTKRESVIHRGISCNACLANPLTGTRFKCANCVDFDVCARCEPSCDHDLTHVFIQIKIPIPRLANPTSGLLEPFYPGNNSLQGNLSWSEVLQLRQLTRLESSDIDAQYDLFKSLCCDKEGISKEIFKQCLGPLGRQSNLIVDQLFKFYDQNRDGFISFPEFIKGLAILSNGNQADQSKFVFEGYDVDDDGCISKDDLRQMLLAYHNISAEIVRDVVRSCEEEMMASYEDTASRPVSAVFNAPIPDSLSSYHSASTSMKATLNGVVAQDASPFVVRQRTRSRTASAPVLHAMTQDAVAELVENIFTMADSDNDGKLSYKEFKTYATVDPSILAWFEAVSTVF